jgi:nucleoside-diphosphate-sugar epimerase
MKALVIGGTRFVGLRLVRLLAENRHEVTLLNRGKTVARLPENVKRLYADRRDAQAMKKVLEGLSFDAVYDITGYEPANLEPLAGWLKASAGHYVFLSTTGVYARSEILPVLEDFPRVPVTPNHAGAGPYIERKVLAEDYLLDCRRRENLPVTILRCPEIYGPENWMHEREFGFFRRLVEGRPIIVPGNGSSLLHPVYVDDVARTLLAVTGKKAALGQVFNAAGPDWATVDGYLAAAEQALGLQARKVYVPYEKMKALRQPVFPFNWERNVCWGTARLKAVMDYQAPTGIREGLKLAAAWWKDNLGIAGTRFEPGKAGYDVDLEFESRLASQS